MRNMDRGTDSLRLMLRTKNDWIAGPRVDYRPIPRDANAYQQPIELDRILAMCRQAFGPSASVKSIKELGMGMYNNTFRVELTNGMLAVLRVAPSPARQMRTERFIHSEWATKPFLEPALGPLIPNIFYADFTRRVANRDFLFMTHLDGVPAPIRLREYPRSTWSGYYRQLGEITSKVHGISGPGGFGPVAGPVHPRWSDALRSYFEDAAADLRTLGIESQGAQAAARIVDRHSDSFDKVVQPSLMHGDLWNPNVLVAAKADTPTITGIVDNDRTWWGDPLADWPIYQALKNPDADGFWDGYGRLQNSSEDQFRGRVYTARHKIATMIEAGRLDDPGLVDESHGELRDILSQLG